MSKRPLVSYHAISRKDFHTLNKGWCTVDSKYIVVLGMRGGGGGVEQNAESVQHAFLFIKQYQAPGRLNCRIKPASIFSPQIIL